ncbi:hypothetical protein BUALT_Bualt12G0075500 [Buddleja alternifolia]|uniref:DUF7887 domain-containing protein n=1 Tax=Buddleja alternifolia TaxID=168488 RepID=A0AAV6WQR0_9LAMI|nr:hypothetical protein BUALT_Bualt12G0075500 [Buddleja alternifolia]
MLITYSTFCCCNAFSHLISNNTNCNKKFVASPTLAKKKDFSEISSTEKKPLFPFKLSGPKILIQSAIGIFALGFIDAGYSGDWSRIGVISRGSEDLLKAAAFLVVPFCLFLIYFLSNKDE